MTDPTRIASSRIASSRIVPRRAGATARGAALLIVLWLIALLTAVIGGFALTARVEHMQGRVLSRGVAADEAARAGLEYAMTRVVELNPQRQWPPNGSEQAWAFGDAEVTVKIIDETGKVDLNAADNVLLTELIRVVGAEPEQARRLASAIVDWRDPDILSQPEGGAEDAQYASAGLPYGAKDAPFESVAELELLLGMTPDLFKRLAPHVTVYSGQPRPSQEYASGEVLQAMGVDPAPLLEQRKQPRLPGEGGALVGAGTGTYSIESRAQLRDGRIAVLRAVVRAGNSGVPGSAYTPLRWEQGALPR